MTKIINVIDELKKSDLISYNFLFSSEKTKLGVVLNIKEDANFGFIIEILNEDGKEALPAGIVEYRKL